MSQFLLSTSALLPMASLPAFAAASRSAETGGFRVGKGESSPNGRILVKGIPMNMPDLNISRRGTSDPLLSPA